MRGGRNFCGYLWLDWTERRMSYGVWRHLGSCGIRGELAKRLDLLLVAHQVNLGVGAFPDELEHLPVLVVHLFRPRLVLVGGVSPDQLVLLRLEELV